jgi:Mg/Co/Ni transporter MgtE
VTDTFDLLIDIANTHAHVVARYLEEHPPEASAALIHAVPNATSTKIFQSMLPYHAAKCLTHLPHEAAVGYLSALEARFAATILRHTRDETRRQLLGRMTPQAAARVGILLRYSHSVVGAWLNPTILVLPGDLKIADARTRLKADSYADYHRIYVVDSEHRPAGFVQMHHLLHADDSDQLHEYVEALPTALPANMSLDQALEIDSWRNTDYLPVVDREGQLIGILRYADLRAATSKLPNRKIEGDLSDTMMDLAESCYLGLADVLNTSLAAENLPSGRRRN